MFCSIKRTFILFYYFFCYILYYIYTPVTSKGSLSLCFYLTATPGLLICHLVYVPRALVEWEVWLLSYGLVNKEVPPRVPVIALFVLL